MTRAPRPFVVTTPRQIRALRSPVRQEIVDAIAVARAPMTINAVASTLGRRADALYYHVAALQRAGLLTSTSAAQGRGRPAKAYDVPGRPFQMTYSKDPAGSAGVLAGALSLARRDMTRALSNPFIAAGPARDVWGGRLRARLTPAGIRRVNELLHQLADVFRSAHDEREGRPFALTWALSPAHTGRIQTSRARSGRARAGTPARSRS